MCPLLKSNELHKIFEKLDRDNNGYVSLEELHWFLNKVGVISASLNELEAVVGQSNLDLQEFIAFYESKLVSKHAGGGGDDNEEEEEERDLVEAFKVFDMNNDGFISCDELERVLSRLELWSGGDCRRMIQEFDTNDDGMLDFEEFKNMMLLPIP